MNRLTRQRRRVHGVSELNLTPLIDTALTLLVIFMVTTPMIQNSIKIDLPQGNAKEAGVAQQELVVHIDKQEHMYLNGTQMVQDKLLKELHKRVAFNLNKTVFVKADQAVRYGHVVQLVDQIKMVGGVRYVALATQHRS
jgi:biopolymer transport protein TolR